MSERRPEWRPERRAGVETRRAMMARDAGLRRISSVTRWLVGGAVALSGALALVAANAFHGRAVAGTTQGTTTASQSTTPATTTPATTTPATTTPATTTPLTPPSQAPTTTTAPPVAVSGGS